jgi:hypothetical protein
MASFFVEKRRGQFAELIRKVEAIEMRLTQH